MHGMRKELDIQTLAFLVNSSRLRCLHTRLGISPRIAVVSRMSTKAKDKEGDSWVCQVAIEMLVLEGSLLA